VTVGTVVRLRTYAKINLHLRVIGKRDDGFHEVETILHGIGLYDELEIEVTDGEVDVSLELGVGMTGMLPAPGADLISRCADLLRARSETTTGVRVRVTKGIPIGAGLGGGSGNAAGALVVLGDVWGMDLDRATTMSLAAQLGSDVPYCIEGGTALATSRGEQLTPLPNARPLCFVLGGSNEPLYTADVYAAWDHLPTADASASAALTLALGAGDAAEVAALLHNDLEPAAFSLRSDLAAKKQALVDAGALGAGMSGSGPTMFGIAADEKHARRIAEAAGAGFDWVKVVGSHGRCIERLD
jgi:4-diphosphocytidyl-2-C-methyl-D-erythritol kinase